ncbi:MAG: hypothetical protein Q8Q33_00360 [Chlamydiota bacterium]|nr:hypothetical protein [Chlamydiota bacterium]
MFICCSIFAFAIDEDPFYDPVTGKIRGKTYQEWVRDGIPFFTPTSEQVMKEMEKDAPKGHVTPGQPQPGSLEETDEPINEVQERNKPIVGGARMFVEKPTVPLEVATPQTQAPLQVMSLTEGQTPVEIALPGVVGQWAGKYYKLVEYYNVTEGIWEKSEASLEDVPISLAITADGKLQYAMEEREGVATYTFMGDRMDILSPDMRIRGDFKVEKFSDGLLTIKSLRELFKDQLRVFVIMDLKKVE